MPEKLNLPHCHDCGALPGAVHLNGCDVERCSVCGTQRMCCGCKGHDRKFARWTGIWPGAAEAKYFDLTLNDLYDGNLYKILFIKPK